VAGGPRALPPQRGLGKAIVSLRAERKMTGAALAERSEVSASWISRIEDGQGDPTWATTVRIARGLGVSMEVLASVAERFEGTGT
jgi:transcriptional regulator with XRE-family HTH domain